MKSKIFSFLMFTSVFILLIIFSSCDKKNVQSNDPLKFNAVTIDGEKITQSVFKDYKLTMINIWGTFCQPCIMEMPDLQKLYTEIKTLDVNLIGIIADTPNAKNERLGKNIIAQTGVKYQNIIPDKLLAKNLLSKHNQIPTSIFVDQKGNIINEDPIVGSRDKNTYLNYIKELLKKIDK